MTELWNSKWLRDLTLDLLCSSGVCNGESSGRGDVIIGLQKVSPKNDLKWDWISNAFVKTRGFIRWNNDTCDAIINGGDTKSLLFVFNLAESSDLLVPSAIFVFFSLNVVLHCAIMYDTI